LDGGFVPDRRKRGKESIVFIRGNAGRCQQSLAIKVKRLLFLRRLAAT
jgi:hypothetical protein